MVIHKNPIQKCVEQTGSGDPSISIEDFKKVTDKLSKQELELFNTVQGMSPDAMVNKATENYEPSIQEKLTPDPEISPCPNINTTCQ